MKPFVPIQNVTEDLVVFKLFITRLISGVIVLAIAVAAMLLGGNILFAFVASYNFILFIALTINNSNFNYYDVILNQLNYLNIFLFLSLFFLFFLYKLHI